VQGQASLAPCRSQMRDMVLPGANSALTRRVAPQGYGAGLITLGETADEMAVAGGRALLDRPHPRLRRRSLEPAGAARLLLAGAALLRLSEAAGGVAAHPRRPAEACYRARHSQPGARPDRARTR